MKNENDDIDIAKIADVISSNIPAEKIYLFGSYAYGNPNQNSDLDIYVIISDNTMRPIEAMRQIHHLLYPLELKKPVDILVNYKCNFDKMKNCISLEQTVEKQGEVIYER